MKKTLLALSVVALAAGSAQAYNFHVDQTGTDVDFYGSLRVKWESTSNKTNYVAGGESKEAHQPRSRQQWFTFWY